MWVINLRLSYPYLGNNSAAEELFTGRGIKYLNWKWAILEYKKKLKNVTFLLIFFFRVWPLGLVAICFYQPILN